MAVVVLVGCGCTLCISYCPIERNAIVEWSATRLDRIQEQLTGALDREFGGKTMQTAAISIDRVQVMQVLTALHDGLRHRREELVELCPDLTQQQIFVAIDYLIRSGQLCMALEADGTYWVWEHGLER